jgi:hypothetical protein
LKPRQFRAGTLRSTAGLLTNRDIDMTIGADIDADRAATSK